jgi:hypothetical protein
MARARTAKQNDILTRFTELGQEALNRLTEVPGGGKIVDMLNESKARLDEMQKRLRGLDELEKRVAKLEKQLGVGGPKPAAGAKKPSSRTTAAKKPATPKKPPA